MTTVPKFIQIHTLHSYSASLLNRDDAGLAKRIPFGGVERLRVSSQCLKRHWRMADDPMAIRNAAPEITPSVRSRRSWQVLIHDPLVVEGLSSPAVQAVLATMQGEFYGNSEKAKSAKKGAEINLNRGEVVVLGHPEIEYLKKETRRIVSVIDGDPKKIPGEIKDLKTNFRNLRAGAGLDAAIFGRFMSGDREARVDAAVHVAHALTVHPIVNETDYFSAVDDLPDPDEGHGAGHINSTDLTTGVYYGYVVVDVPLLVSNLEGPDRKEWLRTDRTAAARTVHHLLHLIAKITPGAKLGATAPYDWASMMLVEAGEEQPRTLANAFLNPVRAGSFEDAAGAALSRHVGAIDRMYGTSGRRWLATRIEGLAIEGAVDTSLPALADAVEHAIRQGSL